MLNLLSILHMSVRILHSTEVIMQLFSIYFVVNLCAHATAVLNPQVNIPLIGSIEGLVDKSVSGRNFYSFEGVPYAEPPVANYRFKAPTPAKPWTGIRKANKKIECLQYTPFSHSPDDPIEGTEDCLYLNIYSPKLEGNLSVLVNIHAGAFILGSGIAAQPHILLDRDVVVVTFNYRLGPLGFLSTEDEILPGNNGLKDQILALKWIKKNIGYFGGNPNLITIIGASAGGASVHFHTLSPKSKGLFSKAISTSGCMMNPWVLMEKPLERTLQLASFVGCSTANITHMMNCLEKIPGRRIVETVKKFQPWQGAPFSPFAVVVDEWSSDPVLPKHPYKLLKEKSITDVPWMVAHTPGEGHCAGFKYDDEQSLKYLDEHWNEVLPHILHFNFTVKRSLQNNVSLAIRNEYLGDEHPTRQNVQKIIDLIGDRLFKTDIDKCTRLHATAAKSPVFHYLFSYRGAHSLSEVFSGDSTRNFGAVHADDSTYIFKSMIDTLTTEQDRAMSKLMVDIVVSFANDGKPSIQNVKWISASKNLTDSIRSLKIESPSFQSNERVCEFGNRRFWDSLPFEENEKIFTDKTSN